MDRVRSVPRRQPDRPRQFSFKRSLVIDLFGELADAELGFHQFETDRAAFRKSPARRGAGGSSITTVAGTRMAPPLSENLRGRSVVRAN